MIDTWTKVLKIQGWMTCNELKWLYDTASLLPDGALIVEVGAWKGRSTCALGLAIKNTSKHMITVDHFEGSSNERGTYHSEASCKDIEAILKNNINSLELDSYITVLKIESELAVKDMFPKKYNMLFLDGDHTYDAVCTDLKNWIPLAAPRAIISGHDYQYTDVMMAVNRYSNNPQNPTDTIWQISLP